ncbi:IclR family transcriptional regulator [Halogeometricum sp. S1BR25-6]|uniref:IclR family transcriptional regulator n=1 Tax=Halogeometricum salsisoli TaxID=2950536 RepID=A0ABU2GJF9_9EURY|nr:IclR family transcriptional regulator [Halogeometricum sp. S1BR25-6]MDS0300324.1 IclR family transcriptional regulator [Halogeometricum sp. S1BR25-6]
MSTTRNNGTVKTARTTFQILEELKRKNGATVTELTEEFDLSNSSIHNYLSTLEEDGYVIKNGTEYKVGLRLLDLGGFARRNRHIYDIAKSEVTALAESTGEMANLVVEEKGKGVYLHRAHGNKAVRTDSYVGQRVHLHNTALGKTILAHLPEERVDEIIEHHGLPRTTPNTITTRDALLEELETVREAGVSFDDEARVQGLRCVAVPIINNNDRVEGAISVSGPTSRLQNEYFTRELPEELKSAANVIELNITYM